MFENLSWLDVLLLVCLGIMLVVCCVFAHGGRDIHRERKAAKLIESARGQLRAGGDRTRVLAGLAYMAKEAGVEEEVNRLWPRLYQQMAPEEQAR